MSPGVNHQVRKLYVSNFSDGTISIINTATNEVTGRATKVGGLPQDCSSSQMVNISIYTTLTRHGMA